MIDISQWRASIGLWTCRQMSYSTHCKETLLTESSSRIDGVTIIRKIKDLTLSLGVFLSLLLILSGDVELNPGPKTGITSKLSEYPTREELCWLLNDIRDKWYEIGLSLQISRDVLDDLKHREGIDEFSAVIIIFVTAQPSTVTWETVITAIESPIVNDKKTADLIRRYLSTFIPRTLKEIPDDLFVEFQYYSDKWYEIGLSLQIHRNLLDDLKLCWKSDIAKIKEVIRIWENTKPSPITWETVMTAVESPVINSKELADRIRQKLMQGALYRVRYNPDYFGPTDISISDNPEDPVVVNPEDSVVVSLEDPVVVNPEDSVVVNPEDPVVVNPDDSVVVNPEDSVVVDKIDSCFLYEAIEKGGFVEARISKVLIQGPARVGKTSVKCLILSQVYDKDKPYSTGIAECPQIAFQHFGKNKGKWELVSDENIIQMFAKEIKYIIENNKSEHISKNKRHGNEKDSPNEVNSENIQHHKRTELMLNSQADLSAITSMPERMETNAQDLAEQLTELLNKASGMTDKFQMYKEWFYFIDSGGQIQFQQILQAFIPCVSVVMLVISLKEDLSSQSCTKFQDEDGTIIVSEHSISIKTLLRRLISMVSFKNEQEDVTSNDNHLSDAIKLPKMPKVIAVATHEDKKGKETIEEKESQLREIFESTKFNIYYENAANEKILFNVDGRKASEKNVEDESITKIRSELSNQSFTVKIPLKWYAFEIFLRNKAMSKNTSDSCCGILTLEECRSSGIKLGLESAEIVSALKFFHLLNTILYYPPEVTNLVFISPYNLIQVVNELTILVCKVRRGDNVGSGPYALQQMAKFGILSSQALSNNQLKMFKQMSSNFTGFESHLFNILTHLSLASKLPHYILHNAIFMPALLPLTDPSKGIPCSFINDTPLLFYFEKGTPVGFFCAMIVNLLSKESKKDDCNGFQWKLHDKFTDRDKFYSNFVVLRDDKSKCTLALVESFDYFEIHCKDSKDPPKVKEAIESAIIDTASRQKQMLHLTTIEKEVIFKIAFYSPCGKETEDGHFHIATIVKTDSRLFCIQCDKFVEDSKGSPHLSWIICVTGHDEDFSEQAVIGDDVMNGSIFFRKPDKIDVLNQLACISSSWHLIGTSLKIKHDDLQSMAQENTNDKKRLSDVLEKWIEMDGQASPVTWHTIIKVIQGPLVEKNDLAIKMFQSLKQKECKQKTINKKQQEQKKPRKGCDSSDSESVSYSMSRGCDSETVRGRYHKCPHISKSSSKEHSRLSKRKRTNDRKQRKQKKLSRLEEFHSYHSKSDRDLSPKKQRSHHMSPESYLDPYDASSGCDEEPGKEKSYKRKRTLENRLKMSSRKQKKKKKGHKRRRTESRDSD